MIKNNTQLLDAKERLNSIRERLAFYKEDQSNIDNRFLILPLETEEANLASEIQEYLDLRELPFDIAIDRVLNKHMLIDNIGELLAKIRIAAKKSQSELSKELGWEQSNLSRFENENYSSQTVNKIVEYASALGVWLHVVPSLSEQIVLNKYPADIWKPIKQTESIFQNDLTSFQVSFESTDASNKGSLGYSLTDRFANEERLGVISDA